MNQELKTQYLTLKLKISQMLLRLQENEKTIKELNGHIGQLQVELNSKTQAMSETALELKELEKNFKKSDKIGKIVVNRETAAVNTAELKKKLDKYIVEIDHCIEQLRKS